MIARSKAEIRPQMLGFVLALAKNHRLTMELVANNDPSGLQDNGAAS